MGNYFQFISKNLNDKKNFISIYLNDIFHYKKLIINEPPKDNTIFDNIVINKDYINKISNKKEIIKKRNATIDLLRIITMLGIVYTHVLFQGKGIYKYNRYRNKLKSLYTYVFWHNNAYGLISGIVGYKSTKYSNLLYIWLCVVFYSVSIRYYYLKYKKGAIIKGDLYKECFPIIYVRYWYCTSYFGMFMFLPAINKGIQYLNKSEFKLLVMSIYGIFVFWQTYINYKFDTFLFNEGHSSIWLACLYIIGAYIGKFNVIYTGIKRYIFSFIYFFIFLMLCSLFNNFRVYKIFGFNGNKIQLRTFIIRLMSRKLYHIIRTTLAICVTLFFLQLKYNKYLSKIITFCGPLTFGIYLIHFNSNVIHNYLRKIFKQESYNLTANEVIKILILKSLKLFMICISIEYLRYSLFSILKIRNICIYIEKIASKIVN
jgi:hypothetical protein